MNAFKLPLALAIFIGTKICLGSTVEERLAELENKTAVLESAMLSKLNSCRLVYKPTGYRLNTCDRGSFVKSIVEVGGNSKQLECGSYHLECAQ